MKHFRVHGDNIVECERFIKILLDSNCCKVKSVKLLSPSTLLYTLISGQDTWNIELLPGFNKSGRSRWSADIFNILRKNGSYFDETPDIVITKIENESEAVLCAVEFCSALQAGNQAWQRSARAFSTGLSSCPYIYIVDFVKYELDPSTRQRKNLRFPNAAVPFSYINYSKKTDKLMVQVYTKSEEFNKSKDKSLINFADDNFGYNDLIQYFINLLSNVSNSTVESTLLIKNLNVVKFLSSKVNPTNNYSDNDWNNLFNNNKDIIEFAIETNKFPFTKKIANDSKFGHCDELLELFKKYAIGIASKDLPFGVVPKNNLKNFAKELQNIYKAFDNKIISKIEHLKSNLIICAYKGFKPRGDDARPDRGLLPLISMLSSPNNNILTYIYGQIINYNYELLMNNPLQLAKNNGLWKSTLSLSDFILIDAPVINGKKKSATELIDNRNIKYNYISSTINNLKILQQPIFSSVPNEYHEDDVDTAIHYLFTKLIENTYESMCNPPGGDWSGLSLKANSTYYKWLSLPRVSNAGKRPDHVIELFDIFDKPILLLIESKEKASDLEESVGTGLIKYVKDLFGFVPSVIKNDGEWDFGSKKIKSTDYEFISAAAYIKSPSDDTERIINRSKCEMLFALAPTNYGWNITLICKSDKAKILKKYLCNKISSKEIILN